GLVQTLRRLSRSDFSIRLVQYNDYCASARGYHVSDKLNNSSVTGAACTAAGAVCRYADELLSLREQVTELSQQVFSDALTGLYNYRYFNQRSEEHTSELQS